jgi:hypothetical protein
MHTAAQTQQAAPVEVEPGYPGVPALVDEILVVICVSQMKFATRKEIIQWFHAQEIDRTAEQIRTAIRTLTNRGWLTIQGGQSPNSIFWLGRKSKRFI